MAIPRRGELLPPDEARPEPARFECRVCGSTNRLKRRKRPEDLECWFCGEQVTDAGFRKHGRKWPEELRSGLLKGLVGVVEGRVTAYALMSTVWKRLGQPWCPEDCPRWDKRMCPDHGRGPGEDPKDSRRRQRSML